MAEGDTLFIPGGWAKPNKEQTRERAASQTVGARGAEPVLAASTSVRKNVSSSAVLFVLNCRPGNTFSLALCNSTEGTNYHPSAPDRHNGGDVVHAVSVALYDIPRARLCNPTVRSSHPCIFVVSHAKVTSPAIIQIYTPKFLAHEIRVALRGLGCF